MSHKALKPSFLKFYVLIFGFLFSFAVITVLEIIARLLYPFGISPLVPDLILNHTWRPNSYWEHSEFESVGIPAYVHHYNAQAWLEKYDITEEKPEDTFRIFFLGDSFTEGTVPMEQSMPALVEGRLLDQFREKGKNIEIINTGTSSYSPILYYILFDKYILRYSPDLILINVDMTDVFDDFLYRSSAQFDNSGRPQSCPPAGSLSEEFHRTEAGLEKSTLMQRTIRRARKHLRFLDIIYDALQRSRGPSTASTQRQLSAGALYPGLFDWCYEPWSAQTTDLVQQSLRVLQLLIARAKEERVQIAITGVPHLEHFTGEFSRAPFDALRQLSEAEQIPFFDSFGGMQTRMKERPQTYYIPGDMHMNPRGYSIWAEAYLQFLHQARLLEDILSGDRPE